MDAGLSIETNQCIHAMLRLGVSSSNTLTC